jgi:hypothetical protein
MSARLEAKSNPSTNSAFVYLVFLPILLWTFLATVDGPVMHLGSDAGAVVYKSARTLDRQQVVEFDSLWIGLFPEQPQPVYASFLLLDLKQNLRRWPNIAGDISRSPPFYRF